MAPSSGRRMSALTATEPSAKPAPGAGCRRVSLGGQRAAGSGQRAVGNGLEIVVRRARRERDALHPLDAAGADVTGDDDPNRRAVRSRQRLPEIGPPPPPPPG